MDQHSEWVTAVLTRSRLLPAPGQKRQSIPPLDSSLSVFSQAQRVTGHSLGQLFGLEFMANVSAITKMCDFKAEKQLLFFFK